MFFSVVVVSFLCTYSNLFTVRFPFLVLNMFLFFVILLFIVFSFLAFSSVLTPFFYLCVLAFFKFGILCFGLHRFVSLANFCSYLQLISTNRPLMDAPVRLRIQPGKWRWSRAAKERAVHVRPTTKIGVQGETCWSSLGFSKLGVQISWLISTFPMKWWKNRVSTISGHANTFANDSSKQNIGMDQDLWRGHSKQYAKLLSNDVFELQHHL